MSAFVRCSVKKCKFAVRIERASEHGLAIAEKSETRGHGIYAYTVKVKRLVANQCPKCTSYNSLFIDRIQGTVTDHECDPRCTGATGKNCECSCGGKNHGMAA